MKSTADWRTLPGEILDSFTEEDWLLLERLVPQNISDTKKATRMQLPLFSRLEFAALLSEIYPQYQSFSQQTLARNLKEGACYCAGGRVGSTKSYPNLFVKNLIRMYHWVSDSRAPYKTVIGFPRESGYSLTNESNWLTPYPPHEDLHRVFMQKLYADIDSRLLTFTASKSLRVPHYDKESNWLLDACLVSSQKPSVFWFIETYTGSEGFAKRLSQRILTAYYNSLDHPGHQFVFLFPKEQNVNKFWTTYSKLEKIITKDSPFCYAYSYRRLESFKALLGVSSGSNRAQAG